MTRYRRIPVEVDAVQYRTGAIGEASRPCGTIDGCVMLLADKLHVRDGDWILTHADGRREIVDGEAFVRLYERIPSPPAHRTITLVTDGGATTPAWCEAPDPVAGTVRVHRNGGSLLYDLATGRPVGRDSGPWRIVAEDLAVLRRAAGAE